MKYVFKKREQLIIKHLKKKINEIPYILSKQDRKLQKYEISIILKFLWELHIIETKILQGLLVNLNEIE